MLKQPKKKIYFSLFYFHFLIPYENSIFYYLTSDYIKDSKVYETVKYYPSVIIFKEGKIINYLKYDSDSDIAYYKSYDGFLRWLKANVKY